MNDAHAAGSGRTPRRRALTLNATELLRQPGTSRVVDLDVALDELGIDDRRLAGDVDVYVTLDSTFDRIIAHGELAVDHVDTCSRCLQLIADRLTVAADEHYSLTPPVEDPGADEFLDSFPIEHGQLDLAPMVRETLLLAIPEAPLCRTDCRGLCPVCGADLNAARCTCDLAPRDERWAVLDQLREDL